MRGGRLNENSVMANALTKAEQWSKGYAAGWIFVVLVSAVLAVHGKTTASLLSLWIDGQSAEYSHGLLLVALSAALVGRSLVGRHPPFVPGYVACVVGLLLSFVLLLANIMSVRSIAQLTLVLMIPTTAWFVFGQQEFRRLLIPLLLPVWAVPIWSLLNEGALQLLTAYLVAGAMNLAGIPVMLEGVVIHIPSGIFRVAENCSGMRQLLVCVPLFLTYSYLAGFKWKGTVLMTAMGGVLAVLSNTIRILIVVLSGHFSDMQHYFVTEDHVVLGWVVFALCVGLSLLALNKYIAPISNYGGGPQYSEDRSGWTPGRSWLPTATFIAMISSGAVIGMLSELTVVHRNLDLLTPARELGPDLAGWNREQGSPYRPVQASPDVYVHVTYRSSDGRAIYYHGATFFNQKQGREAVSSDNKLADGVRWTHKAPGQKWATGEQTLSKVNEIVVEGNEGERLRVWSWYSIDGVSTASDTSAKLLELRARLLGRTQTTIHTLAVRATEPTADRQQLQIFWRQAASYLSNTPWEYREHQN